MNQNFTKVQNRTIQYWFDGLAECAAGLIGLFVAVLFWIWPFFFMWRWSLIVILVAGLAVSFGLRLIINRIKERTTYPRTGYAAPTDSLKSKRSLIISIAFILIFIGSDYFLTTRASQNLLWSPGLAGFGVAWVFTWIGTLTKRRQLYILAILSLCVGIALAVLGVDYFQGIGILAGVVGLILLYQGYRTHKVYIKQNPLLNNPIDE
jgi:MFS family permease